MSDSTADTTEKVERTEHGYRLSIESTRGTGTRDQDKVKAEARTETLDELQRKRGPLVFAVSKTMQERRADQPDGEETDE